MTDDRGCFRNRILSGGGSTSYTFGGPIATAGVAANNTYGVVTDIGCGSAARTMVSPSGPGGLPGMGGGRRRRRKGPAKRRTARKQHGGRYGFGLEPQMIGSNLYAPNQYASVIGMRGETCTPFNRGATQMGGGAMLSPAPVAYPPTLTASAASYQAGLEVGKAVYTNVIPPGQTGPNTYMLQQPLGAAQISGACLKTGGRRRSHKGRKASRKGRKSRRSSRK
jgi:hypothetical protein